MTNAKNPIVIFDGDCAFCNKSVMLILKKDKTESIEVCSNQSQKGKELIEKHNITADINSTIIYLEENKVYYKSTAALTISKKLKGLFPLLYLFMIVPRFIRDGVYDFIAKHRKKIIKKEYSCEFVSDESIRKRIYF
jgi:predicted DCC family thiol-disulfide oxidoreductase YuxK